MSSTISILYIVKVLSVGIEPRTFHYNQPFLITIPTIPNSKLVLQLVNNPFIAKKPATDPYYLSS